MAGPAVVLVLLTLSTMFTLFFLIKSKHEEMMAKIEHGIVDSSKDTYNRILLNFGIFLLSIGFGITIGYVLSEFTSLPAPIAFLTSLFISGGLGFIISYFINSRINREG